MTSFNDDDLKKLKSKEGYWRDGYEMRKANGFQISESWGWVDGLKIEALISRLEAAERLLAYDLEHQPDCPQTFYATPQPERRPCSCGFDKDIEAWRKASGK